LLILLLRANTWIIHYYLLSYFSACESSNNRLLGVWDLAWCW